MMVESKDYEQHQYKKVTREHTAGMEPGDMKEKKGTGRVRKPSHKRKKKKQIKERTEPSETANLPNKCYLGGFDNYKSYSPHILMDCHMRSLNVRKSSMATCVNGCGSNGVPHGGTPTAKR